MTSETDKQQEETDRVRVGDHALLYDLSRDEKRPTRHGRWVDLTLLPWIPYIWKGYRSHLEETSVPLNSAQDRTDFLAQQAKTLWHQEVESKQAKPSFKTNKSKKKEAEKEGEGEEVGGSLISVMFKIQRFELACGLVCSLLQGLLFSVARPLLLGKIISIVSDPSSTTTEGVIFAVLFALVVLVEGVLQAQVKQLLSCRVGSRFIGWMSSLVHEKSTVVSAAAVADAGFQESALIGSDVTRMVEDWRWMCLLPYAIVALFGGIAILAYKLKMASLVGFGIMFSIAFFNYKITQAIKKVEEKDFAAGDLRISILREILAGIKAIKMMAWELPFRKLLEDARDEETRYIKKYRSYAVSSINFGRASPILAASFSILTLALTDPENLTAETIFVSIASFQGLRLPLISIPLQSTMLVNTLVSFKRIKRYLTLPNASPATPLDDASPDSVRVTDATFHWGKKRGESSTSSPSDTAEEAKQFCLKNISFHVKRNNNLVAVVGKVGSGKSSLISSILGSMQMEQGSFESVDNVAYIPQKAFVMSGTVTDNVLMGHPMNKTLFSSVLRASALDIDLEHLPDGINTEIGERGQTLSGGQAARVSIARALYHQPELLILDDPLSAVDPEVANNLFRRSVLGFLGRFGDLYAQDIQEGAVQAEDADVSKKSSPRRSVLMSLNQLHLLPYFDHIIVLHQGEIAEQGSFEELQERQDGVLVQMMQGLEAVEEEDLDVHLARDKKQEQQISEEQKQQPPRQDSHVESGPEEADQAASKEHHVLIAQEKGQKGAVSSSILVEYFRMQGLSRVPFSFLFAIGAYAFMASADLYLANWIKAASPDWTSSDHLARAGIYIVLSLLNVLGIETLSLHNTKSCFLASKNVHSTCMDHMLHAPITWYEETPSGRIISRFSGDLSMIDRQLAFIFDDTFQFIFLLLSLTIVVCYIVPELIAVVLLGVGLFVWQIIAVDRTNREVKRYANQALAPILTNVAETVGARDLIRCMHLESYFCQRHYAHVDRYTSNVYMSHSLVNFSTLMSGFISFLLSTGAALVVVFRRDAYDPSMVGLALTYSFLVPYFLGILSVIFPIGFAALTSLERILEYRSDQVPQEPAWYTEQDKLLIEMGVGPSIVVSEPVPSSFVLPEQQQQKKLAAKEEEGEEGATIQKAEHAWPSKGQIEFSNVSLVYRPGLAPAVKNLTVTFYGGQKHGICGRTGAGKSSITNWNAVLLFRVHECATGRVLIDGQDIRDIGLQLLRSSLTIIPQTPLLLSGNLRENLDPFKEYSDEKLRSVMEKVGLKPSLLEMEIVDDENSKENKKKSRSSKWASRIGSFKRALSSSTKYSAGKLKQIEAAGSASANTGKETTKGLSLSVGEKQLLSLARALLREESSRKIVVLDEPTSSLDVSSDDQIQRIVKREFRNATTLVIAHRLGSIIDSDRILVMDRGSLAEYGVPADLLKNENGHLFQMVSAMGDATSKMLIEKANNSAANDQAVV